MKKTALILALLVCAGGAYAFVDKTDIVREDLQSKLNELRVVKGMYFSGRSYIYLDPVWGRGDAFTNVTKKNDFGPLMNLYMNVTAFPMPALEIGGRMKFALSTKSPYQVVMDNLYAEFIAFQFILIRFGQMSEKFTPFSLWSTTDRPWLRSELFRMYFKEDLAVRLLDTDNSVPFQGLKIKFDLNMGENDLIRFKAIGSKILDEGAQANSYDRYMVGVMPGLSLFSDAIIAEGAYLTFFDNTNSGSRDYNPQKKYDIFTGAFGLNLAPFILPSLAGLGVQAEGAMSRHVENGSVSQKPVNGVAWKANLFVKVEKLLDFKAGYRQIAYEFVSPGAQTRFVTPFPGPAVGSLFRNGDFYDYLGFKSYFFQNYFRNKIQFTRDNTDALDYTYSMNEATPNRQGFFGQLGLTVKDWIAASCDASMMSEVAPVAAPNKVRREFLRVEAEGSVNLKTLVGSDFLPKLSGFCVMENNDRDAAGALKEDLRTMVYGGEVLFDFKLVKLVGMYQRMVQKGQKTVDGYDVSDQNALTVAGYDTKDMDLLNVVYGGGVIVRISQAVDMQVDCLNMDYVDLKPGTADYSFIQGRALIVARF
jgi:hypothetical protein